MDPEWKERIARYNYRINVATASKEDLKEYMETKIYKYNIRTLRTIHYGLYSRKNSTGLLQMTLKECALI